MAIKERVYVEGSAKHKRETRKEIFPKHIKFDTVVTMLGPSVVPALEEINKIFGSDVTKMSYEIKKSTYQHQLAIANTMGDPKLYIMFGDILDAPIMKNTFYDIDGMRMIYRYVAHLLKFRENCSFTFALVGLKGWCKYHTIDFFFKTRGETRVCVDVKNEKGTLYHITSSAGEYIVKTYRDGRPMINFTKIK